MIFLQIHKNDIDRVFKFCQTNDIDCDDYSLDEVNRKYELGFKTNQDAAKVKKYLATKPTLNVQSREEWLKEQMSKPLHEIGLSESGSKKRHR